MRKSGQVLTAYRGCELCRQPGRSLFVMSSISATAGADQFKAEWVDHPYQLRKINLDAPFDFNANHYDSIVNPWSEPVIQG